MAQDPESPDDSTDPSTSDAEDVNPSERTCGTMAVHEALVAADPSFADRLAALEDDTAQYVATAREDPSKLATARGAGPVRIPVVVHVIHDDDMSNISGEQVQSQIDVLNADYRKNNADVSKMPKAFAPLAADANVEFYL